MRERRILKQKDHILLLKSEIIKEYPELFKLLKEHSCITKSILNLLPSSERNIVDRMLNSIVAKAWDEWEGKEDEPYDDLGSRRIKCSLCQSDNKLVFLIQNRFNGTVLNVGSTCILEFGSNLEFGRERKSVKQIIKERRKIARKASILREIPEASTIDEWFALNYSIVLPTPVTRGYRQCGERLIKIYNEYLDGKRDRTVFKEISQELARRHGWISQFDEYVEKNKDKPFVATKEIAEWSKYHLETQWNDVLNETGFVTWGIACRLVEKNFMSSLIPLLNQVIYPVGMQISGINEQKKAYLMQSVSNTDITIGCSHNYMLLNFGAPLFQQQMDFPLSLETILKEAFIANDRTLVVVLNELESFLKRKKFSIYQRNYEANEIIIYENDTKKYLKMNMTTFANKFLSDALGSNPHVENMLNFIKSSTGKRYTYDEIHNFEGVEEILYEKKNIYRKPR